MFTSGSPSQGQLSIGIALVLEDRFSNQARMASKEIRSLQQDAKNLTNANLNAVKGMASMAAAAGAGITMGLGSAVYEGAQFIDVMTFVGAIAKNTGTSMEDLSQKAKTLGRDTMFTSKEIASAMQYMAMAGQGTTEIYNNIAAAANLANATMTQLGGKGGTADIMTNIMKMYEIPSSMENSTRVADVLTKAVTRSNTNLMDMGEAIKYAGTTATNLGASLEQTAAAIGVLGDAGIQGSMAGTALANAYRYLSRSIGNPNYKGNKALASLGLTREDFLDAKGNLIDLGLAMQKIAAGIGDAGNVDKFNVLIDILGVRGERAGTTMIKAFKNYSSLLNEIITQSDGSAEKVRSERMERLWGAIEVVRSTWENLRTSFAEALEPAISPYLKAVGGILQGIQAILDSPIGPFIATLTTGAVVVGTITASVVALRASMKLLFNDSMVSLRNMFAVMNVGWKGATISAAEYAAIETSIIAQRKAGMFGTGTGNAMLWANLAMTNPGRFYGGMMTKRDKTGASRYYVKNAAGRTVRISQAAANTRAMAMNPRLLMGGAAAAGAGAAGGLLAKGGLGVIGRGLMGFLGGPWGLALTAIITLGPLIYSAVSGIFKNSEETNSELSKLNAAEQRKQNLEKAAVTPEERTVMLENQLLRLSEFLAANGNQQSSISSDPHKPNPDSQGKNGDIVIYIDGKKAMRKEIKFSRDTQVVNVGGI